MRPTLATIADSKKQRADPKPRQRRVKREEFMRPWPCRHGATVGEPKPSEALVVVFSARRPQRDDGPPSSESILQRKSSAGVM